MLWTKREESGTNGAKTGEARVVAEQREVRPNAFVAVENISSVIAQNGRRYKNNAIQTVNKGRETPSLDASSHRECGPGSSIS